MRKELHPVTPETARPYLRYARYLTVTEEYRYNGIIPYDGRMLYVIRGEGGLSIDTRTYPLHPGTLLAWQPGQCYGFTDVTEPLETVMLNLDYSAASPSPVLRIPDPPDRFGFSRLQGEACWLTDADGNGVLSDSAAYYAEPYMRELVSEYEGRRIYADAASTGMLLWLLTRLSRSIRTGEGQGGRAADEILAYIRAHLAEEITYVSLAEIFRYHPNHVNRIVTRATGVPLHRYLVRLRMERAFEYLSIEGKSVAETAELCGFADGMSFAKCFKRHTGHTPSEIRCRI